MGFVTPSHWSRTSAFGLLNRPSQQVGEDLRKAFCKARTEVLQLAGPTTREFPLTRLRKRFIHAMSLDVVFSPRFRTEFVKDPKYPNSRIQTKKVWEITPVWKCAPKGALIKANRLCSLLRPIVTDGWKANILHDLVQLSRYIWTMSLRDFFGLCRRIASKIAKSTKVDYSSSPEPALRFGTLSANPICNPDRVYWRTRRQKAVAGVPRKYLPRRLPNSLWLIAQLLTAVGQKAIKR